MAHGESAMLAAVGARNKYDSRNQRTHEEALIMSMIQKNMFDGTLRRWTVAGLLTFKVTGYGRCRTDKVTKN